MPGTGHAGPPRTPGTNAAERSARHRTRWPPTHPGNERRGAKCPAPDTLPPRMQNVQQNSDKSARFCWTSAAHSFSSRKLRHCVAREHSGTGRFGSTPALGGSRALRHCDARENSGTGAFGSASYPLTNYLVSSNCICGTDNLTCGTDNHTRGTDNLTWGLATSPAGLTTYIATTPTNARCQTNPADLTASSSSCSSATELLIRSR